MKYRSRTDIVSQILEIANGGTSKTRIMYGAFLSYTQLSDYLSTLMANGLLEHDAAQRIYKTTEKGQKLLKACAQMLTLSGEMTKVSE